MAEARWKAYISGKKYGPVDDETIRQWIAEHRVTGTTQVWRPGMPKWLKAREVAEFSMYFDETVAAIPALQEEAPGAASKPEAAPAEQAAPVEQAAPAEPVQAATSQPAPVQAQPLAPQNEGLYADDDAPTVVQASPFVDVDERREERQKDSTIRVQPTQPEKRPEPAKPVEPKKPTPAAAAPVAAAPRPGSITRAKPGMPLVPFFLLLVALLPAASFGYLLAVGMIDPEAGTPFYLMSGAVVGLVLIMIPPLFMSMAGLFLGLLGGLAALGCWVTLILTSAGDDLAAFFKVVFLDTFQGGPVGIAMGVLNWCTIVVSLLAILYFATSRKYRARARA